MKKEYFEILLEAMDSKFQLTMEAFSSLDAKIDRVRDEVVADLGERIDIVDCKVMGLAVRVERLEEKVDQLDKKVERLEEKVDQLDKKVDQLDKRVDRLEEKVDQIDKKVDSVHAELVEHRENVELHKTSRRSALKKVAG